ncbi:MAG: carboxypeptidase-like regulatory domain-containing protein [Bryobacteraceae bacterium]|nr:carboxypeptidase-like regulatory domain-containing protein [Bryobacteraceae bacterium]
MALPLSLFSQSITGRMSGTVTDATGAVIPGAKITIINEATKLARTATTDPDGFYVVPNLPVGNYTVTAELQGFKKSERTGNNLVADGRLAVDFRLQIAGVEASIEVTAAAGETVNTVSGEVGRVIDTAQVQDLALNGRNYMQLSSLIPGAVLLDEDQLALTTNLSITAQSINGTRGNTNYLALDGGSNMDSGSNGSQINNVGIDFIREVNIKSSAFSAEFGRNSGSSINVVTRGGGDQFHGGVREFFRNNKLDARNTFAPVRPPLRFNNFGWDLGGPILRGKLFFFGGQEYKRIRQYTTPTRRSLPTRAERAGDFTARSGNLRYPGTTDPIVGRNISSMITPQGAAIARVYDAMEKVAASYVDTPTSNNTVFQDPSPFNWRQDIARLDYKLSEAHNFYFRYMHDHYNLIDPYGVFFGSQMPMTPTRRNRPGWNYQIAHTWLPTPNIVNELKLNSSWNGQRIPMVGDAWKRATYGLEYPLVYNASSWEGAGADGMPDITISNFANINGPRQALMSPTTDIQFMESVTFIRRAHTIKAGFTFIRNRKDQNGRSQYRGSVAFNTSGNNLTTANAFADALLGNFRTYTEASGDPTGFFRFSSYEGYVSDAWRVNRKLSVEIGVRWQRNDPTYTQANNITNFVPGLYNPSQAVTVLPNGTLVAGVGNPYNGLVRPGEVPPEEMGRLQNVDMAALGRIPSGAPRGLYDANLLFAPRVSLAYAPFNSNKTAIRAGFGLFYDKPEGNIIFPMVNYTPWLQSVSLENANLRDPRSGRASALTPFANIDAIDPNLDIPYTMTGNFGIQQELPAGTFLELTYVGTFGRHLLRQPDINYLTLDQLRALNEIPSAQRPSLNSLRPFKGYSAIRQRISDSTSNYHALQSYLTKRKGRLNFTLSYTWSKVLAGSSGNGDNPDSGIFWRDRNYSYGPASFDRSHVIVGTYSYRVPTLAAVRKNAVGKTILGGWEVSGIIRGQTGGPLTISASTLYTGGRRANYLGGNPINDTRNPNAYLNRDAFAPADEDREGTSGAGNVRGPGLYLWDFSLRKETVLDTERGWRLRFQADFFNMWNRVNYRNPGTSWGSLITPDNNFGTITTAGPPRNIQLGLKFNF